MSCHSSKNKKQEMEKKGKWSIMSFCHKTSLLGIVESFLSVYLALLSLPVSVSVPETGRIDVCIRTH